MSVEGVHTVKTGSRDLYVPYCWGVKMPATFADLFILPVVAAGYALALLTAWEVVRGWFRHRDQFQIDTFIVITQLVAILLLERHAAAYGLAHKPLDVIFSVVFLSQPFCLLRLVQKFHRVSRVMWRISIGGTVLGAALTVVRPPGQSVGALLVLAVYFTVMLSYPALAFTRQSRRAEGAAARRLWWVATGTWLHVAIAVVYGLEALTPLPGDVVAMLAKVLGLGVFASYYVGLVCPRSLRSAWAESALNRYQRDVAARPAETRGQHAAADLVDGTLRSIACSEAAVLLFSIENPTVLRTAYATGQAWHDMEIPLGGGLIADALRQTDGAFGFVRDIEHVGASRAADGLAIVVPIATDTRVLGALIVVQRSGSLFPHDDLAMAALLCRHAAAAIGEDREGPRP